MKKKPTFTLVTAAMLFSTLPAPAGSAGADATSSLLATIKAVGREGAGNVEAARAWQELVRLGPAALPAVLAAFDDADATVANWLRPAVDTIADRALAAKQPLPTAALEQFIAQPSHSGVARRLAYEWLARVDPTAPDRLLPGMLHDASLELRRDAIELILQDARQSLDKGDKPSATTAYRKALSGARDRDQVDRIVKELKALGVEVDPGAHFGFIRQWRLIGPFDSSGGTGFQHVFPPEKSVAEAADYSGKNAKPVRWARHTTADPYGVVDLNKALGKHMGAAAYAFAAVASPTERPVQIRAGSQNAIKIFLNGKQIFFREEYHHGMQMDQHSGAGTLRAGRNEILIKVCQNEQTDNWAQNWSFQVRVCDQTGGSVPMTVCEEKP
jgi:hypothetical protein